MPDRHDTQVFWDVDACPLPYDDPYLINQKIRSALQKEGYRGDVTIWAYVEKLTMEQENMHKYMNAGIWIVHKVAEGKKTVVNRMIVDILYFGMNHSTPSNFMVISKVITPHMASILRSMKERDYTVFLALPDDDGTSETVPYDVTTEWNLSTLLQGGRPINHHDGTRTRIGTGTETETSLLHHFLHRSPSKTMSTTDDGFTCVFWDVEDCPVPKELVEDPDSIYRMFDSILDEKGYPGELSFRCYADKTFSDDLLLKYRNAKIPLLAQGDKDERMQSMVYDILLWALDHPVPYPEPGNFIVIANHIYKDGEFYDCVESLSGRDYNVHLVQPDLFEAEPETSLWPASLLDGGKLIDLTEDLDLSSVTIQIV